MYQSMYSPSRRGFIKQASYGLSMASFGTAAAGSVLASQSSGMPSESAFLPEKKAGWAIVGLGKYATEQIMPAFAECKKSKLVALVSGTPGFASPRALVSFRGCTTADST